MEDLGENRGKLGFLVGKWGSFRRRRGLVLGLGIGGVLRKETASRREVVAIRVLEGN